jgi:hypothetical protein
MVHKFFQGAKKPADIAGFFMPVVCRFPDDGVMVLVLAQVLAIHLLHRFI